MLRGLFERRRLESSFAFTTTLLVVCVVCAALAVVHWRVHSILMRGMRARGYAVAQSIGAVSTPSLLAYNYVALQAAAEHAVEDSDLVYVIVHDKEGAIAGLAGEGVRAADLLPGLPDDLGEPTTRDVVLGTRPASATPIFEAVVPVNVEGSTEPWGVVRVGLSYAPVHAELKSLKVGMAGLGLALLAVAVAIGRLMARRIAAPLRDLADGTEALSAGDTTHRITVRGARELAELAQAFNLMMDRVQEKDSESTAFQEQLERLNLTLEQQVRKRTLALEESEAQYRTLVEHSPDSIVIVQRGRVRFVNRAFAETFGVDEQRVADERFRLERLFEQDCQPIVEHRLGAWERGEPASPAMVTAHDATGRPRELELRGSRIEYLGFPAAECLLVDMTETQRLREELEDTQRLRALGELSSGVAHDFNNLLGAILGRVQLLRDRGFDLEIDREMAVIEKAAQDGRETVRRIQEFSRTRTDRPFVPLSLPEILNDAIEITRGRWKTESERRNVKVDVNVSCDEVPPILGNDTELREVFTNLILNAADAMPQGGSLQLRCFRRGDEVHAEVEDTGVGMTEEIRRHLFDPFFTTKGARGTGLGLSVAYGIVTRHGGSIEVTTALGTGTRFRLVFPCCEPSMASAERDRSPAPRPDRPARVLVIDDEQPIAQLIQDALAVEGHQSDLATSGAEGLRLASRADYDLVLTDLGMPDMSGWEVASRLHEDDPEMPVVLVTGWGTTISDDEIGKGGVADVVHKPFEIRDLIQTVHRVIARRTALVAAGLPRN